MIQKNWELITSFITVELIFWMQEWKNWAESGMAPALPKWKFIEILDEKVWLFLIWKMIFWNFWLTMKGWKTELSMLTTSIGLSVSRSVPGFLLSLKVELV